MPLLDKTLYRDSLGTFISDLVLQILSWIAEEEREKILKRQREGFDATGVNFGRSKKEITEEFKEVYRKWNNGELTIVEQ